MGTPLIGRESLVRSIQDAAAEAAVGRGRLLLLAGEAGIGKTHLARAALEASGLRWQEAVARPGAPPFELLVTALRTRLRDDPGARGRLDPYREHLAALLPELGHACTSCDRGALHEALRQALLPSRQDGPRAQLLEDLHWADDATLDFLLQVPPWLESAPLLVIGTYRQDGLARQHGLRRLRAELRRQGRLHELSVPPLEPAETSALAQLWLRDPIAPEIAAALHERTRGVPFFIVELAGAIDAGFSSGDIELPATIRDAVRLRVDDLPEAVQGVLECVAVAGQLRDDAMIADLGLDPGGVDAAIEVGMLLESEHGQITFRQSLVREAIYAEIPGTRRRALHRQIARILEARGTSSIEQATHWEAARERLAARAALVRAAEEACARHGYRDALLAAQRALALWPEGEDPDERQHVLRRLGECALLSGDHAVALQAWREAAHALREQEDWSGLGAVQRSIAELHALQGDGEAAHRAHEAAAEALDKAGRTDDAVTERLAMVEYLEDIGAFSAAHDIARDATAASQQLGRQDLLARALALQGQVLADRGNVSEGLETIRRGLTLALDSGLVEVAAEAYYRLATAMSHTSDYSASRAAYHEAISFCQTNGAPVMQLVCLGCLAVILRKTGEWDRGMAVCQDVLDADDAPPPTRTIAAGLLGSFLALRGERSRARPLLVEAAIQSRRNGIVALELDTCWSLALLHEQEGDDTGAAERYRAILERASQSEDRHYVIAPLSAAVTFFAARREEQDARASTRALAQIASGTGNPEALAAAALALGECAWMDGQLEQAAREIQRALEPLTRLNLDYERARVQLRAGMVLAELNERTVAIEHLSASRRTAQRLGARPLANLAAEKLESLGESVAMRRGRRAAAQHGGLSARELEVLRLVAQGQTSPRIAAELVLSPRTVEMYVGNILSKLGCSSRAEAVGRAHELGIGLRAE